MPTDTDTTTTPVSYTHLDVYKRQRQFLSDDRGNVEGKQCRKIHRLLLHRFDVGANRDADYLRLFDGKH